MTCHARLQLTQDTGSRTHRPLNKTYRITLFKAPPGAEDQDKLLEMYNTKPQKALKIRPPQAKAKVCLFPLSFLLLSSLYVFPNTAQLFGARLSTRWLAIPLVGERGQDVLPTGAHKHTPSQSRRRLPAKKTLSTTAHSAGRTRNSRCSRAVSTGKFDGLLLTSP